MRRDRGRRHRRRQGSRLEVPLVVRLEGRTSIWARRSSTLPLNVIAAEISTSRAEDRRGGQGRGVRLLRPGFAREREPGGHFIPPLFRFLSWRIARASPARISCLRLQRKTAIISCDRQARRCAECAALLRSAKLGLLVQLYSSHPVDASRLISLRFSAGALGCALALTLSSGFFAKGPPRLMRKKSCVARPFEVGSSLSGNFLAAIVANSERDTFAASTFSARLCATIRAITTCRAALIAALANGNMPKLMACRKCSGA